VEANTRVYQLAFMASLVGNYKFNDETDDVYACSVLNTGTEHTVNYASFMAHMLRPITELLIITVVKVFIIDYLKWTTAEYLNFRAFFIT